MKILEQVFEEITITDNDTTGYSYELTLKNKTLADIASFFGEENLQEIRLSKPTRKAEQGTFSTSMRVNTKPAKKLEYNGHWILFSSSLSIEQFHACADAVVETLNDFGKEPEA